MKKTWKKLGSLAAAGILTLSLAGCGGEKEGINEKVQQNLFDTSVATVETLVSYDKASMEQANEENPNMDDFTKGAFTSWIDNCEELGAYLGMEADQSAATAVRMDSHKYIVTLNADFENRDAVVELVYSGKLAPESVGFNPNYTMGEKMQSAAVNTVIGIATVFLMLLFLSFVISLMKYVPKLEAALTKKKAPEAPAPAAKPAPVVAAPAEEELVDDGELVAVIAAAIAAAENTSTDAFVVRSIIKSNKRTWR